MPSGPVAESESRFDSKLSTLSGEKDTESRESWVRLRKVGTESDGFWTQDFDANTEFRHSAFYARYQQCGHLRKGMGWRGNIHPIMI